MPRRVTAQNVKPTFTTELFKMYEESISSLIIHLFIGVYLQKLLYTDNFIAVFFRKIKRLF